MTPEPIFTRMCDVESRFSVAHDTIRNWIKKGAIRHYKPGGVSLVKTSEVVAYIESNAVESGG